MTRDEIKTSILGRVAMFMGEANATEGLPDPDPDAIDGVTHALFMAREANVSEDDIFLAALAFQYGIRKGERDAKARAVEEVVS